MTFLFDRNFDEEASPDLFVSAGSAALTEGQLPSENERRALSASFENGRQSGIAEGRAEVEANHNADRVKTLDALAARITELHQDAAEHRAELEQQMLDFVLEIGERVFPEIIESAAHERAIAQLRRCFALAIGKPRLTVFLSEDALEESRAELEGAFLEANGASQVELRADPTLIAGDARMEWENGAMRYSFSQICTGILETLRNAGSAPPERIDQRSEMHV